MARGRPLRALGVRGKGTRVMDDYWFILVSNETALEAYMADTLSIGDLPSDARRELLDFYDFLKAKYGGSESGEATPESDPYLYEKVKIDTTKLHFSRDEIHERG